MVEIFPDLGTYGTCRSAEERTLFLPIWFNSFQYAHEESAEAEIGHEAGVFSHLLFMLSLELLLGAKQECINIVVICMLNTVAEHLRAFLRWALPAAMEHLRVSLGLPAFASRYDSFNFDTLVQLGMLRVLGPVVVRGFTFRVAFWLGL